MLSKIFFVASLLIVCASAIKQGGIEKPKSTKLCPFREGKDVNYLSSPNYPNSQRDANLTCLHYIDNPQLKTILIDFFELDIEKRSCGEISVMGIYKVNFDSNGNEIGHTRIFSFRKDAVNGSLEYSYKKILIQFLGYKSSCRGFYLAYALRDPVTPKELTTKLCPVREYTDVNYLISPNYPNSQRDANLTCLHYIDNPQLKTIYIEFFDLDIENSSCGEISVMGIYKVNFDSNGNEIGHTRIFSFRKDAVHGSLEYSYRKILIQFLGYKSSCRGFNLAYALLDPITQGSQLKTKLCTVKEGEVYNLLSSPNYPNNQRGANLTCHFVIDNPQLKTINIQLLDHDSGKSSCGDFSILNIYNVRIDSNGLSNGENKIFSTRGLVDELLKYSNRKIRIEFLNYKSSCRGFLLQYLINE